MRWKDDKGARTFLALAALFVPACTAQIAGFLYVQLGYPALPDEIFRSAPIGENALLVATIAGSLIALPSIFMAFSALARPEAGRLTFTYLVGNLALVIPQREPGAVALLAGALLGLLAVLDQGYFAKSAMMKHWDGDAMRLAMFLPFLILVGRNLLLFDQSAVLIGVLMIGSGGMLFLCLPGCSEREWLKSFARLTGYVGVIAGWSRVASSLLDGDVFRVPELVIPVVLLPMALWAMLLSFGAEGDRRAYRRVAGVGAMGALSLQLLAFGESVSILVCLAVAVALLGAAFWSSHRVLLVSGVAGFLITFGQLLFSVREIWAQNLWVSLGALEVLILLTSSLLERNWQRLQRGSAALRAEWRAWE